MAQEKTPGVYINEASAFPNSVVEVPTAVPAFVGYTKKALRGSQDVTNIPVRVTSLQEFENIFGTGPSPAYKFAVGDDGKVALTPDPVSIYNLYDGMRLFFNNGGGPCWIVSVGGYTSDPKSSDAFGDKVWDALKKEA